MILFHFHIFIQKKILNILIEINRILEVFHSESALSSQTGWGKEIFHPIPWHGLDLKISLVHQPFKESIDQAQ